MPKGFDWSEETRSAVSEMYREGRKPKAIAAELSLSYPSVMSHLKRAGLWQREAMIKDPSSPRGSEIVRRFEGGEPVNSIAEAMGIGRTVVRRCLEIAGTKGIQPRPAFRLTPDQRQSIVDRYVAGETASAIALEYGIATHAIRRCVRLAGQKWRTASEAHRSRSFDETAFDVVTEESAYWIGFLMADGSINDHGKGDKVISLALKDSDIGHLEKFRAFLKSDHSICLYDQTLRGKDGAVLRRATINITSHRLADALASYGVVPRKSKTAKVVGLEWNRDFWRGAIDGDGSLYLRKQSPMISLAGSHNLMSQFRDFVKRHCPECNASLAQGKTICSFATSSRYAQRLIEVLYRDCIVALDRKREIARRFIENPYEIPPHLVERQRAREARIHGGLTVEDRGIDDDTPLFSLINSSEFEHT